MNGIFPAPGTPKPLGRRLWPLFAVGLIAASHGPARASGDGERLALRHCGRCHVVGEANRFGGIDSTPSFAALRAVPGWRDKLDAFWTVGPHVAVIQIEGLTDPFPPERPPPMAPIEITMAELEAIRAFIATIEPKDLGGPPNPD
jgi:mono/diheme cytochrome c family protein